MRTRSSKNTYLEQGQSASKRTETKDSLQGHFPSRVHCDTHSDGVVTLSICRKTDASGIYTDSKHEGDTDKTLDIDQDIRESGV
jgi:hypothetical protein